MDNEVNDFLEQESFLEDIEVCKDNIENELYAIEDSIQNIREKLGENNKKYDPYYDFEIDTDSLIDNVNIIEESYNYMISNINILREIVKKHEESYGKKEKIDRFINRECIHPYWMTCIGCEYFMSNSERNQHFCGHPKFPGEVFDKKYVALKK